MKLSILLILTVFFNVVFSQENNEIDRAFIYGKSNLYVVVSPTFSPKPTITSFNNPNGHSAEFGGIMGLNIGLAYMYNLNKNIGLSIEYDVALLSNKFFKFDYSLNDVIKRELGINLRSCFKCGMGVNHVTRISPGFVYRFKVANNIDFSFQSKINLDLHRSFIYNRTSGRAAQEGVAPIDFYQYLLENNGNKNFKVYTGIGLSAGINQILKNNRYLNYQFRANIPFANPYTNGTFSILPNTEYESTGTFELNPLSFSLEVNYVFTFVRRKERNDYLPKKY